MSIYANLDTGEQDQVASNTGWSEFGDWVEKLDNYPSLAHLWQYGWSEDIDGIRTELEAALASQKPDKNVASVAKRLHDFVDTANTDAVLTVGDGMEK